MKRQYGFTMIELLITFAVLAALAAIAIPAFSSWLPNYRLRAAARDIYSNFQKAKMEAIRKNRKHGVEFETGNNRYHLVDCGADNNCADAADNITLATFRFSEYDDTGGIQFGFGSATKNATTSGGPLPGSPVTYASPPNTATFNSRGLSNTGYAYIKNTKGRAYALGTFTSGMIVMRTWRGGDWE